MKFKNGILRSILYLIILITVISIIFVGATTTITDQVVNSPTGVFPVIDMPDTTLLFTDSINNRLLAIFNGNLSFNVEQAEQQVLEFNTGTITFLGDINNIDDIDAFSRFKETNLNNGSNALAGFSAVNDANFSVNFGISSSNFKFGGESLPNGPAIVSFSPEGFTFINALNGSWAWRTSPSSIPTRLTVASLDEQGNFNITGNFTGKLIQISGFEPKPDCTITTEGTIFYESNGTKGDFFGCKKQNINTFGWAKFS